MKTTKLISLLLAGMMLFGIFAMTASAEPITFTTEVKNGRLYGVPVGGTLSNLKNRYANSAVTATNSHGAVLADAAKMATGYIVTVNATSYVAIVLGDINGDANLDAIDYTLAKRAVLGTYTMDTYELAAATVDVDRLTEDTTDDSMDSLKYVKIKRAVLGTYDINERYTCDPYDPGADDDVNGWTSWV